MRTRALAVIAVVAVAVGWFAIAGAPGPQGTDTPIVGAPSTPAGSLIDAMIESSWADPSKMTTGAQGIEATGREAAIGSDKDPGVWATPATFSTTD